MPLTDEAAREFVASHYSILDREITSSFYSPDEIRLLRDDLFFYGRYLNMRTRPYAIHTLGINLTRAIEFLGVGANLPFTMLDLGCGLGMQSLMFARLGARVVGIDIGEEYVQLCVKRKRFYERELGKDLEIDFIRANFSEWNVAEHAGMYDAVFSFSAFAHIRPLSETVARIRDLLKPHGRVFVWDANPSFLFSRRGDGGNMLPHPRSVQHVFATQGFENIRLRGGAALPAPCWQIKPLSPLLSHLDQLLTRRMALSFTFVLTCQKAGSGSR